MPLLLEDVVEIPDLDAPVDRRRDDTVVGADHQRLDLHNPLEKDGVDLGLTLWDLLQRGTWKWATILFTRSPVFMSQQSSSCLTKGSIVLSNKLQKNLYWSPYPSDCQLIVLGYDDVAALVEPEQKIRSLAKVNNISLLGDVPDAVRKLEVLEALVLDVPKLEPVQSGRTTPLLSSFWEKVRKCWKKHNLYLIDTSSIKTFSLFSSKVRPFTQAPSSNLEPKIKLSFNVSGKSKTCTWPQWNCPQCHKGRLGFVSRSSSPRCGLSTGAPLSHLATLTMPEKGKRLLSEMCCYVLKTMFGSSWLPLQVTKE